jgi:pimeloyl-ACP methyl ester carboxylesterase/predicted glycosyltransferase
VGLIEREGVRVHWSRWGDGDEAILFLPPWAIVHSRMWKGQIPWFARRFRVLTFDPRGNGRSDRPAGAAAYAEQEYADDALAVLDATGTDKAWLVSLSRGAQRALLLADQHPERVAGSVFIGPALPLGAPLRSAFGDELGSDEEWNKFNEHYWRRDHEGFLEFFFGRIFNEPHSTKQIEDCVGWGLETDAETLIATEYAPKLPDAAAVFELCDRVDYPVLVLHGARDEIRPLEHGRILAEAAGGRFTALEASGHCPQARDPVGVNLLLEEFVGRPERQQVRRTRHPRALYVSSPIGLGHAQRDLAIARELRAQRPGLEIEWLAQHPVTAVLEAAGETIHPASRLLANESAHIESRAGEHELHVFQAIREMDEILVANFMAFHDVVREQQYDLWIGDEAWEVDYFLHENPALKTAPYVFLTDFVGWLPVDEREERITADYNAENIEHVEGKPWLRDGAVFVGDQEDLVGDSFGAGLPSIREWVPRHFDFSGYVLPFDPADYADTERLRVELGLDPQRPLIVASVGGSGVGAHLLRRVAAGFAELRRDVPEAELLLVCGPRIDPDSIEPVEGMTAVGYVHDLFRTFACCDLAVVQGGLTTTMELVANRRPFVYVPLRKHFEQNGHVAHRLQRYGAPPPTPYDDTTPAQLAQLMRERLGAPVDYLPVATGGAARAAELILAATGGV